MKPYENSSNYYAHPSIGFRLDFHSKITKKPSQDPLSSFWCPQSQKCHQNEPKVDPKGSQKRHKIDRNPDLDPKATKLVTQCCQNGAQGCLNDPLRCQNGPFRSPERQFWVSQTSLSSSLPVLAVLPILPVLPVLPILPVLQILPVTSQQLTGGAGGRGRSP